MREKARAEWLGFRNKPDKGKANSHGLDDGEEEDQENPKDKGHSRDGAGRR